MWFKDERGQYLLQNSYDVATNRYWGADYNERWRVANPGYYLSGYLFVEGGYKEYTTVIPCTNAPLHSHYTGPGTPDIGDCPWECDCGYVQSGNSCVAAGACAAGVSELRTSTGVAAKLYARPTTSPSIHISYNGVECTACLAEGTSDNAINIGYGGKTYHTIN